MINIERILKALVPPDRIIRLKLLSSKNFSRFKVESSKFRDQEGFRAFPHSAEPVPRQHSELLFRSANYPEILPHLVMMAFLHRLVNGSTLEREYAIGSGRMDICLRYDKTTLGMELKV
jgi:hypothetical protein